MNCPTMLVALPAIGTGMGVRDVSHVLAMGSYLPRLVIFSNDLIEAEAADHIDFAVARIVGHVGERSATGHRRAP